MTDSALPQPALPQPHPGSWPSQAGPYAGAPAASDPVSTAVRAFWRSHTAPVGAPALVACLAVGVVAATAVVGHRPGLGLAVAAGLVWVPAVPALLRRRAAWDVVLVVLSVALAAVVAVRAAGWVVALCLVASVGAGLVAASSARTVPALLLTPSTWALGAVRAAPWLGGGLRAGLGSRRDRVLAVARTTVVTLVLLVVFGALFSGADVVFASYVPTLDTSLLPGQVAVAVAVAVLTASLVLLARTPPSWAGLRSPAARPWRRVEWLVPLVALDALVLAFLAVQAVGLLGGHRHVLETAGLTYAQYARQGFAQLVAATALTLLVVSVAARKAPRGTAADRAVSRAVLGLLCLATLGVVATALRRMDLYVDAFGLTRTRLLVVAAELAFAVVLLLVAAAGIRWRATWLPRAVVLVAGVAMLAVAAVNPDAQIVRHNTSADLDVAVDLVYLRSLSDDAAPAVADLDEPTRSCVLRNEARTDEPEAGFDALAGWNLGRSRADSVRAEVPELQNACG